MHRLEDNRGANAKWTSELRYIDLLLFSVLLQVTSATNMLYSIHTTDYASKPQISAFSCIGSPNFVGLNLETGKHQLIPKPNSTASYYTVVKQSTAKRVIVHISFDKKLDDMVMPKVSPRYLKLLIISNWLPQKVTAVIGPSQFWKSTLHFEDVKHTSSENPNHRAI